jgi:colanic acid/amylovoran biosynthesis glycosyltransferase
VGGIPELIEDSVSGYLVDRGDDAAMAEKILALAADAELRKQMGRRGKEIAHEKFDLAKSVKQLIDCYDI